MDVVDVFGKAAEAVTVKRVFGEPFERNGVTVIPAAVVHGGMGGGSGHDDKGEGGEGGGYALGGRPAGVYVVKGDTVTWRPAVDVNRAITVAGVVAVTFLLTMTRVAVSRARHRHGGTRRLRRARD